MSQDRERRRARAAARGDVGAARAEADALRIRGAPMRLDGKSLKIKDELEEIEERTSQSVILPLCRLLRESPAGFSWSPRHGAAVVIEGDDDVVRVHVRALAEFPGASWRHGPRSEVEAFCKAWSRMRIEELEALWERRHGDAFRGMFPAAARDKEALRDMIREMNVAGGGPDEFHLQRIMAEFLDAARAAGALGQVVRWLDEFRFERDPRASHGAAEVRPFVAFREFRRAKRITGIDVPHAAVEALRDGSVVTVGTRQRRVKGPDWLLRHHDEIAEIEVQDAGGRPEEAARRFYESDAGWRDGDPEAIVTVRGASPDGTDWTFRMLWPSWFTLWDFLGRPALRGKRVTWFGEARRTWFGGPEAAPNIASVQRVLEDLEERS